MILEEIQMQKAVDVGFKLPIAYIFVRNKEINYVIIKISKKRKHIVDRHAICFIYMYNSIPYFLVERNHITET